MKTPKQTSPFDPRGPSRLPLYPKCPSKPPRLCNRGATSRIPQLPENRPRKEASGVCLTHELPHVANGLLAQPEVCSLVVEKAYCSFCGHFAGDYSRECVACGAYVCIQPSPDDKHGCIFYRTAPVSVRFLCPPCDAKRWRCEKRGKGDVLLVRVALSSASLCLPWPITVRIPRLCRPHTLEA